MRTDSCRFSPAGDRRLHLVSREMDAKVSLVRWFREFLKRTLPTPVVSWLRRWMGTARYLRFMSYEVSRRQSLLETGSPLGTLESRLAARRDGFYQQMVEEIVERTDVVLQQIDRKVEGHGARHDERLLALEKELTSLREALDELRGVLEGIDSRPGPDGSPYAPPERAPRRRSRRQNLAASE
jgi:hypothetical protein